MDEKSTQDVFHFDENQQNFEDLAEENGFRYWYAKDLMYLLGYATWNSFFNAMNKAMTACMSIGVDVSSNFSKEWRETNGKGYNDYRLSKFACYMTVMNGDPKKPQVARAQAYFATMTEAFQRYIQEIDDIERVPIREDITEHEKGLSTVAKQAGVTHYAFFQNSGYPGMYNMNLSQLKLKKNIPEKRSPLDFMGKEELAANLFRITQTEARIKNQGIHGQQLLERTAKDVGKTVRKTMIQISGTKPEDLPTATDIKKVKSDLKETHKKLSVKKKTARKRIRNRKPKT